MRFVVDFEIQDTEKVEIRYRGVARVFEVIRVFMATFTEADDCQLEVRAEDSAFQTYTLIGAFEECVAQERRLYGSTAKVAIIDKETSAEAELTGEDTVIDHEQAHTTDDLFRMFRLHQSRLATAYEQEGVTDNYDADVISLAFSNGEKVGSCDFEAIREQVAFIASDAGNIASVLDVGCGAGILYDQLRRHALLQGRAMPHYVGVDYSRSQIERARRKYPNAVFCTGDAADLQFPDNAFDVAVSYSVLSFLPKDRVTKALMELLRVGRHGAMTSMICTDEATPFPGEKEVVFDYWGEDYPIHTYAPDISEVREIAEKSGKAELVSEDFIRVLLPNGREAMVEPTDPRLPWLQAFLDQILALLAPEHGGVENVPRDKVVETMKRGGAISAGENAEFRMEPGHAWYPYKRVKIMPKGWHWSPDGPVSEDYRSIHVVNRSGA